MARVTLIGDDGRPELCDLIAKIRSGRRGNLINIYKALLHSPPLAESWFDHLNAVRWNTELSGRLREIVIIRVAYLNRARYVLRQHIPALAVADGVSVEECEALADWSRSTLFDASERATLAYTDAMTRDVTVLDAVFDELRRYFDERLVVELTVLIGTYNMHTRVVEALGIDLEAPPTPV